MISANFDFIGHSRRSVTFWVSSSNIPEVTSSPADFLVEETLEPRVKSYVDEPLVGTKESRDAIRMYRQLPVEKIRFIRCLFEVNVPETG